MSENSGAQATNQSAQVVVRRAQARDAQAIADIYAPFVTDNAVSFEYVLPNVETMAERIRATNERWVWLVSEVDSVVVGYAYANPFRSREAYDWTVETSAYLAPAGRGLGVATRLYTELFSQLIGLGFKQAIAAIALPNPASLRFHERLGFVEVGVLKQVGYKFGQWHDVAYYQRALVEPGGDTTRWL